MTLGEELREKYALTSLRTKGAASVLLAINDALERAAEISNERFTTLKRGASQLRATWTAIGILPFAERVMAFQPL